MLIETRTCKQCNREFESPFHRGTWQMFCPTCLDIRDHRPSVVEDRRMVSGPFTCTIASLPGTWHEFHGRPGDDPSFRVTVKGEEFGASWHGRIDIFAQHDYHVGDIVTVSEIEVMHRLKAVTIWHPTSGFTQLKGGPAEVSHTERHPINAPVGEEVTETRRYVRIDDPRGDETPGDRVLSWFEVDFKTTLKGYGRQYRFELRGLPVWSVSCSGGARNGRFGASATLAITDAEHPLEVVRAFDTSGGKPGDIIFAA